MAMAYDYLFKIVLIGDCGVGKTSFLRRIQTGEYTDDYRVNMGVDFALKIIEMEGKRVKLQIWDTAGQERYRNTMTNIYFRGAHGIIIMYDITNRNSFESLTHWLQEVDKHAPPHCQKIILGNKLDLGRGGGEEGGEEGGKEGGGRRREVGEEEGRGYAGELPVDIPFWEISVKEGDNYLECYEELVHRIKKGYDEGGVPPPNPRPYPPENASEDTGCYC